MSVASAVPEDPDSDTSSLSSALSIQDDEPIAVSVNKSVGVGTGAGTGLKRYFKPKPKTPPAAAALSPPSPPPRPPSPPHQYVLADNPDIAFIVAFRARFNEVFPRSVPHFGPQDIENGVASSTAPVDDTIERFLCALIGLILNRKKDVEKGHYDRALDEVVQSHSAQWPRQWEGKNPLQHGEGRFWTMAPTEKITFLKTLILWALSSSDAVQAKLKESYKRTRKEDDINQPLSVQPWGSDSFKRRYWLIEGQEDTHFRVYRESNVAAAAKNRTWWSVAGSIEELKSVATALIEEKTLNSKRLGEKILASVPRFEVSEEKRKRREYRRARKAAFTTPYLPSYEGRTRGKRLKYTYSDDDDWSDDIYATNSKQRRSNRINTRDEPAPAIATGPTYTASGRQVRSRFGGGFGGVNGEAQVGSTERNDGDGKYDSGRWTGGQNKQPNGYNGSDYENEEEDQQENGNENGHGNDDDNDENAEEQRDGTNMTEASDHEGWTGNHKDGDAGEKKSLIVQLAYGKGRTIAPGSASGTTASTSETTAETQAVKPENGQQHDISSVAEGAESGVRDMAQDETTGAPNGVSHAADAEPVNEDKGEQPENPSNNSGPPTVENQVPPTIANDNDTNNDNHDDVFSTAHQNDQNGN